MASLFRSLSLSCALVAAPLVAQGSAFTVRKVGKGPREVVLIPGLSCDGHVWDTTLEGLKGEATFHILSLAGFAGAKPRVEGGPLIPSVVAELAAYLKLEKIQNPILVGHSLGGFTALSFGVAHPGVPGGIVVVDAFTVMPGPLPGLPEDIRKAIGQQIWAGMKQASAKPETMAKTQAAFIKGMVTSPERAKVYIDMAACSDADTVVKGMGELVNGDLRASVGTYQGRLLVIAAAADPAILEPSQRYPGMPATQQAMHEQTLATAKAAFRGAPQAELVVVDNSRHFVMDDQPGALQGLLKAFLRGGK